MDDQERSRRRQVAIEVAGNMRSRSPSPSGGSPRSPVGDRKLKYNILDGRNLTTAAFVECLKNIDVDCEELRVRRNELTQLPPGNTSSEILRLFESFVSDGTVSFSFEFFKLKELVLLRLNSNRLTVIPPDFCLLTNLVGVDLSFNKLTEVPECMCLPSLERVILRNNLIGTVSPAVQRWTRATKLCLSHNPLPSSLAADAEGLTECQALIDNLVGKSDISLSSSSSFSLSSSWQTLSTSGLSSSLPLPEPSSRINVGSVQSVSPVLTSPRQPVPSLKIEVSTQQTKVNAISPPTSPRHLSPSTSPRRVSTLRDADDIAKDEKIMMENARLREQLEAVEKKNADLEERMRVLEALLLNKK